MAVKSSKYMSKHELVDYIKRQLGFPTVNVEVTDEQINDSITRAIDDINPWYTVFHYLTIDVPGGHGCIDLSEYGIKDVTDVIKVFGVNNNVIDYDPFTYSNMNIYYANPQYAIQKYSMSIRNQNIHKIISSYAQMYQEQLYATLAMMMQKRTTSALYENISWKFYDDKLYIDTGVPSTSVVTIEYTPNVITVEDFETHTPYSNALRDLSTAYARLLQAQVVGKYRTNGSPTDINYSDMRSDAEKEIERVRREIINPISNRFYITD